MEQRDLIKDEIEKIGKLLLVLRSKILGISYKGDLSIRIEFAQKQFKDEFDIDIERLVKLEQKDLKAYLTERNISHEDNLERLAQCLEVLAKSLVERDRKEAKDYLFCILDLLDTADAVSQRMTFYRMNKKAEIHRLLDSLEDEISTQ